MKRILELSKEFSSIRIKYRWKRDKDLFHRGSRGRVVKAMDLKSIGVSPRRFESCRLRPIFIYLHFKTCHDSLKYRVGKRNKVDYATSFFTSAVIVILIYARVSGTHNKNDGFFMAEGSLVISIVILQSTSSVTPLIL